MEKDIKAILEREYKQEKRGKMYILYKGWFDYIIKIITRGKAGLCWDE